MCKVSIIIPVYNAEKYLKKCLDSVINQSLIDIEILIINDGSNDNSLYICEDYKRIDPRVKVINKVNEGVSIARNKGIEIAKGEYIMFVDADDWVDTGMCENLYNKAKLHNVDLCICNIIEEYTDKIELKRFNNSKQIITKKFINEDIILPLVEEKDKKINHEMAVFRGPVAKLFKRNIIIDYDIVYDKDLIIGEDFIFNLEYLKYVENVAIEEQYLYHYRMNNYSVTKRYKKNPWKEYRKILIRLEKYLKSELKDEEYIDRLKKLKIKYFFICIRNEMNILNNKTIIENKQYIRSLCEDDIINSVIKKYKVNFRKKEDIILFLLRNKIYLPFLIYIKLKKMRSII